MRSDFLDLARSRFSVLEYEKKPVEQDKIDRILEAGLAAPTACNYQPQRILIVDREEDRRKLPHETKRFRQILHGMRSRVPVNLRRTKPDDLRRHGRLTTAVPAFFLRITERTCFLYFCTINRRYRGKKLFHL